MSAPVLMKQGRVAVADVVVGRRLRPVSPAGVVALLSSIAETGIMKDAIHVRKHRSGELRLLAGAHRLAAAAELGWDEIEAKVWTDVTDDWALLIEIDDNLAGAELNPLDTAVFLASRKAVYERLHPETKAGVAGGLARHGSANDIVSFAETTAQKLGVSRRTVERMVSAGRRLGPDEVDKLRGAPRQLTLKDIEGLGKITNPVLRYEVVDLLADGQARSAADARRAIAARSAAPFVAPDPAEEALIGLIKLWSRAPLAARRQFAESHWAEMSRLMRDAAEVQG